ncbi:GntR family transcriptional regulator [Leucobacter weissii]|uniref:GntR family transcriptional regulator n=1 Tax=Leucobacter weissii TaxID=1983706 RepID=A0A939MHD9_9MICO|nr:GntR family transcriptional regulator [Leucobacter weissii]MBO1900959.1 GntR family transcriptional regulator [Leucobacter weissii]
MTEDAQARGGADVPSATPYEIIRERILQAQYRPGELLREVALADDLGVSRTPVREALFRLEHDGVLSRSAKGLRVRVFSIDEIVAVYDAAIVLEAEAARLAALRRTTQQILTLKRIADQAAAQVAAHEDPLRLMDSWHFQLWEAAQNPSITDLLSRLSAQLFGLPTPKSRFDYWQESVESHNAINAAIEQQSPDEASRLMRRHMEHGRDSAARLLME